jgi:hypothetical protein
VPSRCFLASAGAMRCRYGLCAGVWTRPLKSDVPVGPQAPDGVVLAVDLELVGQQAVAAGVPVRVAGGEGKPSVSCTPLAWIATKSAGCRGRVPTVLRQQYSSEVQQQCRSSTIRRHAQRSSRVLNTRWRRRCSWFGTKRPQVQILSPRPYSRRSEARTESGEGL